MRLEKVDITSIELLYGESGRRSGQGADRGNLEAAREAHHALKDQAATIAHAIAQMLPEDQRGAYSSIEDFEKIAV